MHTCWIGIGANIGDARAAFDEALLRLSRHPQVQLQHRSGIYLTRPVGALAGNTFSNAAFFLETPLPPIEVLDLLQQVERELGRVRDVRWGPRVLDLDLLLIDQIVLNEPRLILPHPAAWYRRFVLDPLAEIGAELQHPVLHLSIGDLKRRLEVRPLTIIFHDESAEVFAHFRNDLAVQFPQIQFQMLSDRAGNPTAAIRLRQSEPVAPKWDGVPVAELTATPGTPVQRVVDFCTSILDTPERAGDWSPNS